MSALEKYPMFFEEDAGIDAKFMESVGIRPEIKGGKVIHASSMDKTTKGKKVVRWNLPKAKVVSAKSRRTAKR